MAGACVAVTLCALACLTMIPGAWDHIGYDFLSFRDAATILVTLSPRAVYEVTPTYGPTPYLPPFVLLGVPLLAFPPLVGYHLWLLLNLIVVTGVLSALTERYRMPPMLLSGPILLSLPLLIAWGEGQATGLWLLTFFLAYRAFEQQQDLRAGLWFGVLLLKPQDVVVFALVLLAKRRWVALAGMAATGSSILVTSALALGLAGLRAYLTLLGTAANFQTAMPGASVRTMPNWRGAVTNLLPGLPPTQAGAVTLVLSALTIATLLVIWHSAWDGTSPHFARRMLATALVNLLVSYHGHLNEAALLYVPFLACSARWTRQRLVVVVLILVLVVPYLALVLGVPISSVTTAGALAMVLSLALLVAQERHIGLRSAPGPS